MLYKQGGCVCVGVSVPILYKQGGLCICWCICSDVVQASELYVLGVSVCHFFYPFNVEVFGVSGL